MPKETFKNIPEAKRQKFLSEAALLFAEKGYAGADMGELARRAGVSKGSIYNYFESKEDLFLYVCAFNLELSRQAIYGTMDPDWDIYRQIEHIFESGARFIGDHPEFMVIYLSMSAPGMEQFSRALARETEKFTSDHLKRELAKGIAAGVVRADLDIKLTAFIVNGLYILFLSSLMSAYFQIRMSEYMEIEGAITPETTREFLQKTVDHIHKLLRPPAVK